MPYRKSNSSKKPITQGYHIGTGAELLENSLIFNQPLAGIGGSTWVFETPDNALIILAFSWGVRPNANPEIKHKYKVSNAGEMYTLTDLKVEYKFHQNGNKNWIQLVGRLNQHITIDLKEAYPSPTTIKTAEFIALLKKYSLKIERQIID